MTTELTLVPPDSLASAADIPVILAGCCCGSAPDVASLILMTGHSRCVPCGAWLPPSYISPLPCQYLLFYLNEAKTQFNHKYMYVDSGINSVMEVRFLFS